MALLEHITQLIQQYGPYVIGLFLMYKIMAHLLGKLASPDGYAAFNNWIGDRYNRWLLKHKEELFADLPDIKKHFEKGADEGEEFKILEIGVGPGANFQYYPEGTSVIAIEPNEQFKKYLEERADKFPGVKIAEVFWSYAENMTDVLDDSVSAVVCTLVLCSVVDMDLVLQEVKRVLKPGGRFYFLEHVIAPEKGFIQYSQRLLTPLLINLKLNDNCHYTRETWTNIDKAGFADVKYRLFDANKVPWWMYVNRPHVMGTATK